MTTSNNYKAESYRELLEEALGDEAKAGNIYRNMASIAPDAASVNALSAIAADEDRHYSILRYLITVAEMSAEERAEFTERMERELGHRHPSQVGAPTGLVPKPFPQTYGDWVDLAEAIKVKYADDPVGRASVNCQLQQISHETAEADEAKRWLVEKAGELGIS